MKSKIIPLVAFMLIGCNTFEEETVTTAFIEELDYSLIAEKQLSWNEILSKSKSRYVVYFYSEYCGYCKQVKQEILSYYLKNVDEMYFVDTVKEKAVYKSNDGMLIGTKKISDLYIFGTPFLLEVTDYTVTNWYAGVDSIRLYIDARANNKNNFY